MLQCVIMSSPTEHFLLVVVVPSLKSVIRVEGARLVL